MIKINTQQQLDFLIDYLISERNESIEIPTEYYEKRNLLRALMNIRTPGKLSQEFLDVQDNFLTQETLKKNLTTVEDITEAIGKIRLWQGDIVTLKVDAIVNAANSKLLGCFIPLHNCIDNVIHSSAGLQLREECDRIMKEQNRDEEVGAAKITGAYNLPSKYVIHTVGPAIPQGMNPSKKDCDALASCYNSCLEIANEYGLKSLAFCGISTGVFNFPEKLAAGIAINTVEKYLDSHETSLDAVIFDVFSDKSYLTYKELLFGDD
ncbi:protein-ADP-ribose hydrolase [Methanobrevibacter sp.]|uniref:protein-ADP-ribose hydrolase n=1 Tax=Methanobrevibacter sp. TaxID=66852 RepID=UPI00388E9FA6